MTAEVIEAEVRELPALRPAPGIAATGALALAALTDAEFDARLAALEKGADRIARIQKALMSADVDYGVIPGTKKPTLLKPGAEKLCLAYSLAADFQPVRSLGDGETGPAISYLTRCDLHLGDLDGPTVAVGYGAANSWEVRYRYRTAERVCPSCGQPTIIKGKAEYGGGWVCFKKRGGCGAKYQDNDAQITGQPLGQVDNPDPWDLDVTLAKMAEKRAHVDATLRATGASALFTQDVEDQPHPPEPEPEQPHRDGLIGTIDRAPQAPWDMEARQTPDGTAYGFKLTAGRQQVRVTAIGPIADALAALGDTILGVRATCYGKVTPDEWTVNKGSPAERKIPFSVLELSRIETAEFILPAETDAALAAGPGAEPQNPSAPIDSEIAGLPLFGEDAA